MSDFIIGICHFGFRCPASTSRFVSIVSYWGKAFTHFGLAAESLGAVFAFQEHLKSNGVKIVKEAYERWDGASLYFLDPNGYTLEYIFFDPKQE